MDTDKSPVTTAKTLNQTQIGLATMKGKSYYENITLILGVISWPASKLLQEAQSLILLSSNFFMTLVIWSSLIDFNTGFGSCDHG